jgi:hypothetical protein
LVAAWPRYAVSQVSTLLGSRHPRTFGKAERFADQKVGDTADRKSALQASAMRERTPKWSTKAYAAQQGHLSLWVLGTIFRAASLALDNAGSTKDP